MSTVAHFSANPGPAHWDAVKRIFRYLAGTRDLQLTYREKLRGLIGYSDANGSMGKDHKASVVDEWQCSHDHPNLYLVGSGAFPTVGTANPTLTLCALALRTAGHIFNNLPSLKS